MDSQSAINIVGTVLCIAAMALPAVAVIYYGVRSKMAYAARIRELIRADAYESWRRPPMARWLRLGAAFVMMALCGLVAWLGLLLTNREVAFSAPTLTIVAVLFLGMLVAGMALQWLAVHPNRKK